MADAIFDSNGNVSGGAGPRISAWSGAGQGIANLLAPSTSGISDVPSLLPADSEMGRAMRQTTRYSYPQNINNYAKIMANADARAAQQAQAASDMAALRAEIDALRRQQQERAIPQVGGPWADNPVIKRYNETGKIW